jgi:mRNA deadenylase 3'-5' endonuclease subunit Ccr4
MDASPEVVCLQEVQSDHYESHLYAAMSDAGYEGVYKQKTRQSMGLAGKSMDVLSFGDDPSFISSNPTRSNSTNWHSDRQHNLCSTLQQPVIVEDPTMKVSHF